MPTIDRRVPLLLAFGTALAMVVITGWQGYQLWQTDIARPVPATPTEAAEQPPRPESTVPEVDLAELALFGRRSAKQTVPESETQNLPETDLRLVLRGVLATNGTFPGSALIEDSSGETDVYLAGEALPGNAQLRTVRSDRVIIERGGKLENLYFPGANDQPGLTPTGDRPAEQTPRSGQNPAMQEEIRSRLEQLRQRLQDSN